MNQRIIKIEESCVAAFMAGYIIRPSAYGVIVKKGIWTAHNAFVCPLGALVMGHPLDKYLEYPDISHAVSKLLNVEYDYARYFSGAIIERSVKKAGEFNIFMMGTTHVENQAYIDANAVYARLEKQGILGKKVSYQETSS